MKYVFLFASLLIGHAVFAQTTLIEEKDYSILSAKVVKLGHSERIYDLTDKNSLSLEKKAMLKKSKRVEQNFYGRRFESKAVYKEKEHAGYDPLWQKSIRSAKSNGLNQLDFIVNQDGIGNFGSPHDPTGDVGPNHYVQAVNVTEVAVFDLQGNLIRQFPMATLWAEFNGVSAGDPIILYDEEYSKWIITEFADPANIYIAISDTSDPLDAYTVYNFSTPNFPDYPKYGVSPKALVITTNEGSNPIVQYFIERETLMNGEDDVTMQRIEIEGNSNTEAGFYVSTPADLNGANGQFDDSAIVMRLNDSSWPNGPTQDQVELYSFDIDFEEPSNTVIEQTSIVTTPFDGFPCASTGFGFQCIPQLNGDGLDGLPELIGNVPHLRNFGTHESLLLSFITDVTPGDNLSGIRWMELRRTADTEWELYQEGTFAPDDGLHRYMATLAMDASGNVAMAYNVSSEDAFAGIRVTGRYANDPLGEMTIEETTIVDGLNPVVSFGRFGDYSQMSVAPTGSGTFWFTCEYAGDVASNNALTRIAAFTLQKDTFDLAVSSIVEPSSGSDLGDAEMVTARISNNGLNSLQDYNVSLIVDDIVVETVLVEDEINPQSSVEIQFSTPQDFSQIGSYTVAAAVAHPFDVNRSNDTLEVEIVKLIGLDAAIEAESSGPICGDEITLDINIENLGGDEITEVQFQIVVNGFVLDSIFTFNTSLGTSQSAFTSVTINENLVDGDNEIQIEVIALNGQLDENPDNDTVQLTVTLDSNLQPIFLFINTDDYFDETTWELIDDDSGIAIFAGDASEGSLIREELCVDYSRCYTLIVEDSYGDGICCDFGMGNFFILNVEGDTLIFNDGQFGSQAVEEFCPDDQPCMIEAEILVSDASAETASDGMIMINASNGIDPYQYSIDGGVSFSDNNTFDGLAPGDYEIVVSDASGNCIYEETVTVGFEIMTSTDDFNIQLAKIYPNPTEGRFFIEIDGGVSTEEQMRVDIFNSEGRLVQRRKISKYSNQFIGTFSLFEYASGSYLLKCYAGEYQKVAKVVRQ